MESKSSTSSQMTELYPQYSLMELKFWITRQDLIPELSGKLNFSTRASIVFVILNYSLFRLIY